MNASISFTRWGVLALYVCQTFVRISSGEEADLEVFFAWIDDEDDGFTTVEEEVVLIVLLLGGGCEREEVD